MFPSNESYLTNYDCAVRLDEAKVFVSGEMMEATDPRGVAGWRRVAASLVGDMSDRQGCKRREVMERVGKEIRQQYGVSFAECP